MKHMKITITGSLGNISKPLAEILLRQGHTLTIVSANQDRRKDIEALGAKAAIGDLFDSQFYASAFESADAVYAMTPPNLGGVNVVGNTIKAGTAILEGVKAAGVKRVVMLSSIGADKPSGNGPIAGLHQVEKLYAQLTGVQTRFLRAGFFYLNFYNNIPLIKNAGIIGNNFPGDVKMAMVHTDDIAQIAAEELLLQTTGVRYVISDLQTATAVASALGAAIQKPSLPWIPFTDEQLVGGMTQAGMPLEIAEMYAEMGRGMADGSIAEDFFASGSDVIGKIKLDAFAKQFAEKYNG
jgi:uncharacterized protein YbjT (DUF2867 family)